MQANFTTVRIPTKGRIWELPKTTVQELNITKNNQVTVKCGSGSVTAKVITDRASGAKRAPGAKKAPVLGLSPDIFEALHIPENTLFSVRPETDNSFRLGPVIGILTFRSHIPNRLGYYWKYAKLNKDNGLLYVFRGRDMDPDSRTVRGFYFDHTRNCWQQGILPFPDVVIDRCYPNTANHHALLEKVIGTGKIFNKKTLISKISFFRVLKEDRFLGWHLPETRKMQYTSDLAYFLAKYGKAVLKPINAMKGSGIVLAKTTRRKKITCTYRSDGRDITEIINSCWEIPGILKKASGRKRPYLIQQAVDSLEYRGGPFSLRTWSMKNGEGRWVIPGMLVLGSMGNSFLTNYSSGGQAIPLKQLFPEIEPKLPYSIEYLLDWVNDLTIRTASALDRSFGTLGELGIDLIVAKDGQVWLIEANGNPGRLPVFSQTEYPLWPAQLYQYPLDYATFLAGFR